MAYLQPADYPNYGLPDGTSADWITSATALINNFCRRPDLSVVQYTERLRLTSGSQSVRLTYLPLAPLGAATAPIVSLQGRYGKPRRGEMADGPLVEMVWAFSLDCGTSPPSRQSISWNRSAIARMESSETKARTTT